MLGLVLAAWLVLPCHFAAVAEGGKSALPIGGRKQLFIDDSLIEAVRYVRQGINPAKKHAENPVLKVDKPWEGNFLEISHVLFDDEDRLFKMWYSSIRTSAQPVNRPLRKGETLLQAANYKETDSLWCYAVSPDGIHWQKPDLGLVEYQGSKKNNIVAKDSSMGYLFMDGQERQRDRRYKGFRRTDLAPSSGVPMKLDLFFSPDGLRWKPHSGNPVIDLSPRTGRWGPTIFMGWDPLRSAYAAYVESCMHLRCPLGLRVIGRVESPDLVHWNEAETVLLHDDKDYPDTQFYGMAVMTYHDLYIGMLWIFRTNSLEIWPELVWSRDGVRYQRPFRETPFIPLGANGSFDDGCVYARSPILFNGRLYVYYTGANWVHGFVDMLREKNPGAGIGLATLPADGFVSVDAGPAGPTFEAAHPRNHPGELVTRAFSFEGSKLHVGMEASEKGSPGVSDQTIVKVEILGAQHVPIPGFTASDADPLEATGTHVVTWKGRDDLRALEGKSIRLRFYMQNVKLYSFQFR